MPANPSPTWSATLQAWLELSRISNLPTVWSNALLGRVAGFVAASAAGYQFPTLPGTHGDLLYILDASLPLLFALTLFYTAGMILNDLFDLPFDRAHRPERPLPSGRIRPGTAWIVAIVLLAMGLLALLLYVQPWAFIFGLALVTAIVLYDLLHKHTPHAVWLMGACRGLVYLTAAATVPLIETNWWQTILPLALVITVYTACITIVARMETRDRLDARRWLGAAMIALVLLPGLWLWPGMHGLAAALAGLALVGWLGYALSRALAKPPQTKHAVLAWLAGLSLIDAYFLALLGWPVAALVAAGLFLGTTFLQRHIPGT